jgi:hypothetical protein
MKKIMIRAKTYWVSSGVFSEIENSKEKAVLDFYRKISDDIKKEGLIEIYPLPREDSKEEMCMCFYVAKNQKTKEEISSLEKAILDKHGIKVRITD